MGHILSLSVTELITMSHRKLCTMAKINWLEKFEIAKKQPLSIWGRVLFHWLRPLVVGNAYRSETGQQQGIT
jgi:hypothetical protein